VKVSGKLKCTKKEGISLARLLAFENSSFCARRNCVKIKDSVK
jgi:hypothetical protein